MRDAAHLIATQQDGYAPSLAARWLTLLTETVRTLRAALRGRRTLEDLYDLDDRQLEDIGLTRHDLEAEMRSGALAGVDRRLSRLVARRNEERWRS